MVTILTKNDLRKESRSLGLGDVRSCDVIDQDTYKQSALVVLLFDDKEFRVLKSVRFSVDSSIVYKRYPYLSDLIRRHIEEEK